MEPKGVAALHACDFHKASEKIKVGVSACLLGQPVRYDGGHKRDPYVAEILDRYFHWVPVCPEVESGMGVPRETVRLVGTPEHPRLQGNLTGTDWTARMRRWTRSRLQDLASERLCGYIFKSGSPSSGLERVRIYSAAGRPAGTGPGFFAALFLRRFPRLPVEDERRLQAPAVRENFIERVFAYHRLQRLLAAPFSRSAVVRFHALHKLQLLAHSPGQAQALDRLVAAVRKFPPRRFKERYAAQFLDALRVKTTSGKNAGVLLHILRLLKKRLTTAEKQDLLTVIADYRRGLLPLVVPITLLAHFLRTRDLDSVCEQSYLHPHPKELMLRYHAQTLARF